MRESERRYQRQKLCDERCREGQCDHGTWALHSLVMVRVDTDALVLFVVEGKLAALERFELMM